MSKQPNDQEGAPQASPEAPKDGTKPADAATGKPTAAGDASPSSSYAAKNSRSRRRGKGSNAASPQPDKASADNGSAPSTPAAADAKPTTTPNATKDANASGSTGSAKDKVSQTPANTATATPNAGTPPKGSSNGSGSGHTPPTKPAPPASGGGGGSKGIIAIVLVVVVAIALAITAWQGWERLNRQQQRLDELAQQTEDSVSQATVNDLESRIESNENQRNEALDSTVSELRGELDSYREDVDSTLDQVLSQLSQKQETDDRDWLHAEAAYLLRLANQRLQFEGDVEGAAALLRAADGRLADAANPALTSVRREIANELSALDAVPQVDRTGLYLALNAQQERVADLRLSQEVEERAVSSGMEQKPSGTFQRQLALFGQELKDLVVIRHHDEALETLVTPEQESYLRQSLRLILEQSQLALLKEEQPLYEASIDKALELLNGYYDTERDATQSVISRLEELKQAQIEPELPDISGSQQAMNDFIENRFESRRQGGGDS